MRKAENQKKGIKDRLVWDIENFSCLQRFWELLLDGVSAERMALLLGAEFTRAPTAPQIRSLFKDSYTASLLGEHFGLERAEAALRLRGDQQTCGLRVFAFQVPEGEMLPPPSKYAIGKMSSPR